MIDRIPPQNLEMERATLGSMLVSAEAIETATEILSGREFYREDHRAVFEAIRSLSQRNEPTDVLTLEEELVSTGAMIRDGLRAFLFGLVDSVVTPSNIEHYAREVLDKSLRRRLIDAASRIHSLAHSDDLEIAEVLSEVEAEITDATTAKSGSTTEGIASLVSSTFELIERWSEEKRLITGIPTGIEDLDYLTRGWQPENLIIVGARPSQGKTSLAAHFALTAARAGHAVYIVSQEMSKQSITIRLIQALGRIDGHRMRTGHLDDADWRRVGDTCIRLRGYPITVSERQMTLSQLRTECRRLKRKRLDLVIIDYLQLIQSEGRKENRTNEVSAIAEGLHDLAVELKAAVIALSQLSRGVDARPDHRPVLADLRDSGQVEAAADVVIFPFNPAAYQPDDKRSNCEEMELIVAKQRDGRLGSARALWFAEYTAFSSPARDYEARTPTEAHR